jgi:hypothetical protein
MIEESPNEEELASREGESSGFPILMACNMVTSTTPIATTPLPEETLMH